MIGFATITVEPEDKIENYCNIDIEDNRVHLRLGLSLIVMSWTQFIEFNRITVGAVGQKLRQIESKKKAIDLVLNDKIELDDKIGG